MVIQIILIPLRNKNGMEFDITTLSIDIKVARKVDCKGLRTAAKEIGISFAALSRIENGQVPEVKALGLLCTWLQNEPNRYFKKIKE